MTATPTRAQATEAARSFLRHRDKLGQWTKSDLMMGLGRRYEFPAATPAFTGELTIANIASFILAYAVEIE